MDKPNEPSSEDDEALRGLIRERVFIGVLRALNDLAVLGDGICSRTVTEALMAMAVRIALDNGCSIDGFMEIANEAVIQHDPDAYFKEVVAPRILGAILAHQEVRGQAPVPIQNDSEKPN